jgi:hypothetical protein
MTIEATEILDAGDKVYLAMTQLGRIPGTTASVKGRWWQASTFRGRELVRVEMFPERAQAFEAAGLRD